MLVFSSQLAYASHATPINDSTATATSTPEVLPTNTVGPDGQKLRKATSQEAKDIASRKADTPADCVAALDGDPISHHRFAFVGICEGGLLNGLADFLCPKGRIVIGSTADRSLISSSESASQKAGWDNIAAYPDVSYAPVQRKYDARLQLEWAKGDIPQGVPLVAPDLQTLLKRAGCRIAFGATT
jgi:hypothetical protein